MLHDNTVRLYIYIKYIYRIYKINNTYHIKPKLLHITKDKNLESHVLYETISRLSFLTCTGERNSTTILLCERVEAFGVMCDCTEILSQCGTLKHMLISLMNIFSEILSTYKKPPFTENL